MKKVFKRSFLAKKYPKGSIARINLNKSVITSEYLPSYKYAVVDYNFSVATRTKTEAENYVKQDTAIKSQ